MTPNTDLARYTALSIERKVLFWQMVCHEATIGIRYQMHSGPATETSRHIAQDGVQLIHAVVGHCTALLTATADESQIDLLLDAARNSPAVDKLYFERALARAETSEKHVKQVA
jgi:hypothetical protein